MTGAMEITTAIGCPNNCTICPQDKLLQAYIGERILDVGKFAKVLKKFPNGTRIDFSGFCEPFVNVGCVDMILAAAAGGFPIACYTTLLGLNSERLSRMRQVKFDIFMVHLPDAIGCMGIPGNPDKYKRLLREIVAKPLHNQQFMTLEPDGITSPLIRFVVGKTKVYPLNCRAGNVNGPEESLGPGPLKCKSGAFNRNVLLPNGDVVLCCMDYSLRHVLGNLFDESYENLDFAGIKKMAKGADGVLLCRHCHMATNDNL